MRFLTLDGLRGSAAICVAILHMPHFFKNVITPENSYLAVDFFFVLSGFVISNAYDHRLQKGMPFVAFMLRRASRLYPAYLLGIALGVLVAVAALLYPGSALSVRWSPSILACAITGGVVMLPTLPCDENPWLYPLNPILWSIFFELIAGALFWTTFRLFRNHLLLLAAIISTGIAVGFLHLSGAGDQGFLWNQFHVGLLRVVFSFFLGVAIFRLKPISQPKISLPITAALFGGLAVLLLQPVTSVGYVLFLVYIAFPLIVLLGSRYSPPPQFAAFFAFAGSTSYMLYTVHKPAYQLAIGLLYRLVPAISASAMFIVGAFFFIALIAISSVAERWYELPMRNVLARLFLTGDLRCAAKFGKLRAHQVADVGPSSCG